MYFTYFLIPWFILYLIPSNLKPWSPDNISTTSIPNPKYLLHTVGRSMMIAITVFIAKIQTRKHIFWWIGLVYISSLSAYLKLGRHPTKQPCCLIQDFFLLILRNLWLVPWRSLIISLFQQWIIESISSCVWSLLTVHSQMRARFRCLHYRNYILAVWHLGGDMTSLVHSNSTTSY